MVINKSPEEWANIITAARDRSVEAIMEIGRLLRLAKETLGHGQFLRIFVGHRNPVNAPVPFTERTAQLYMRIAAHPVLSNPKFISYFSPCVGTLYELSHIRPDLLQAFIADGAVHPWLHRYQSTAPDWYKLLTTRKPGVTPLTRTQIDNCLSEMQRRHLPTKRTARAYEAVALAIQGARHSRSEAA